MIIFCVQNKTFVMCLFYARHYAKWFRKIVLFGLWPFLWVSPIIISFYKTRALSASRTNYLGDHNNYESQDLGKVLVNTQSDNLF